MSFQHKQHVRPGQHPTQMIGSRQETAQYMTVAAHVGTAPLGFPSPSTPPPGIGGGIGVGAGGGTGGGTQGPPAIPPPGPCPLPAPLVPINALQGSRLSVANT